MKLQPSKSNKHYSIQSEIMQKISEKNKNALGDFSR